MGHACLASARLHDQQRTPKELVQQTQPPNAGQNPGQIAEPADPEGITAFEAVERELDLKLVRQKRTIPVIVVDHVDEKPIE